MPQTFGGIDEKLIRANENIRNLEVEITRFFQEGKYAILPEDNSDLLLEAIEYHKQRIIPPRFSVLTGEIIHHLRSCLDHIAWQFSDPKYRIDHIRKIEFPVFDKRPVDKDSVSLYERKIKGIADIRVRSLIESLQPYNAPDPADSLIFIIHDMDVIDKHRELVLCVPTGARELPMDIRSVVESYQRAHPESTPANLAMKFKSYGKLVAQISFKNFGKREIQPVISGLIDLFNYVVISIVQKFAVL